MNDFIEWLEGLNTQTLTDELKDDIITRVDELVFETAINNRKEGVQEGYDTAVDIMKLKLDDMQNMKKLILLIGFIIATLVVNAQEIIQSYALDVGEWNIYTEKWDWEIRKKCNVKFILQGDVILANDAAESTYYTYETIYNDEYTASWNAYDEDRRRCIISMTYKGEDREKFLIVIYNDVCYRYIW